ncbi:MAG: efflux RND transporter periplasmic adaptor subunit [Bacteroidaceae bacterium]|nr:efflux RND transporter periplasmic adaptor subunit [Bacteroidaceae bacterium]
MKKSVKWIIIAVIVIGLAVLGIYRFKPKANSDISAPGAPAGAPAAAQGAPGAALGRGGGPLLVRYTVIKTTELIDGINISGSLIPNEEVDLSFETSGKITDIFFEEGSSVRKGQVLAKINDAPLQAQLKKLEAQYQSTEDRLSRQKALYEKEAVSKEAYQDAEANFNKLQADIEEVKAKLEQTELKAPFDGIIGLRQVSVGAYASPNTTVATLTSVKKLKIEFAIPERYAGVLQNGAGLTFTVEGSDEVYNAKVYATNSKVDQGTRTFLVRAIYDNSDGKLVPGRYVSVSLNTRTFPDAIAVPSEAIVSEMGIDKVFLFKAGRAVPQEITKGLRTDAEVQVLSGLGVGDTVITSGTMQLRTGMAVELKN